MEQLDLFSNILRGLRYVQEYKLSALFDTENQIDIFKKPIGFPKIPNVDVIDTIDIKSFRRESTNYQRKRNLFKNSLIESGPGFLMNFLSINFLNSVLGWFEKDGRSAKVNYLYLPGFIDEDLLKHGINTYVDDEDVKKLTTLIRTTKLYISSYKITLSDGLRTMTIKCYEYDGVVAIWEPSFTGDIPQKNYKNFFRFVARMSHEDIIKLKA